MTKNINPGMSNADSKHWNYLMNRIGIRDQNWIDQAACGSHPDPDLWYPKELTGRTPADGPRESLRAKEARRICQGCPVRTECLTFALTSKERHGMWAGVVFDRAKRSAS